MGCKMNDKELLDLFFYKSNEVMKSHGILHISEREIDGKHPLSFYSEITDNRKKLTDLPLFLYEDLFFFSNDLIHFTIYLFILRPFINDSRKEKGTYFQNWYDARYLSYASILHSSVYNFWDRVGDLLNCFFETGLPKENVYIGRVLSNFPNESKDSMYYQELSDIYTNHVKNIVFDRNEDAHNQSIVTSHYYGIILKHGEDQDKMTEIKFGLPEIFKGQIEYANRGFELALRLIEEKGHAK